jgi:Flp pilus assembly protein TadD
MAPANLLAILGLARTTALYAEGVDPSRFSEADGWWARAIGIDPLDPDLHFERAKLLNTWANNANGDVALRRRAIAEIQQAVKVKGDDPHMLLTMARIQEAVGDHAGAVQTAQRVLRVDPGNTEARQIGGR